MTVLVCLEFFCVKCCKMQVMSNETPVSRLWSLDVDQTVPVLVTSTISSCLWNKQSLPLKKHLWKPPSCSYLPSTQIFLVHFRLHYKLLHQTLSTHIHPHNCFLSGSVPKYFFLFLALWTWWWLVRAHQLVWKEILLQLQDRGVPVGEAQRMAGEVAIPKPRGSTHLILISVT